MSTKNFIVVLLLIAIPSCFQESNEDDRSLDSILQDDAAGKRGSHSGMLAKATREFPAYDYLQARVLNKDEQAAKKVLHSWAETLDETVPENLQAALLAQAVDHSKLRGRSLALATFWDSLAVGNAIRKQLTAPEIKMLAHDDLCGVAAVFGWAIMSSAKTYAEGIEAAQDLCAKSTKAEILTGRFALAFLRLDPVDFDPFSIPVDQGVVAHLKSAEFPDKENSAQSMEEMLSEAALKYWKRSPDTAHQVFDRYLRQILKRSGLDVRALRSASDESSVQVLIKRTKFEAKFEQMKSVFDLGILLQ